MKTTAPFLLSSALFLALGVGQNRALTIGEAEANDSLSTAQNIDPHFSLDFSPDIGDAAGANTSTTIPHVTILGTGNGTFDYYAFTVPSAGIVGIFDIDYGRDFGGSTDTELGLYDSSGNELSFNDDHATTAGAAGSVHGFDAFIQYTFSAGGTYFIGVGEFNSFTGANGTDTPMGGNVTDAGDTYTLQVSIGSHAVSGVPEAGATLSLLGGALASLILLKRPHRAWR